MSDYFSDLKVTERNERRSIKGWQWNQLLDRIEAAFLNLQVTIESVTSGQTEEVDEADIVLPDDAEDRETLSAVGFVEIIVDTDGSMKYRAISVVGGVRRSLGNFDDPEMAANVIAENVS